MIELRKSTENKYGEWVAIGQGWEQLLKTMEGLVTPLTKERVQELYFLFTYQLSEEKRKKATELFGKEDFIFVVANYDVEVQTELFDATELEKASKRVNEILNEFE